MSVKLPSCEFRQRRWNAEAARDELVCAVAGDAHLAFVDGDPTYMTRVCQECPIPQALQHPRACLYLRPIRFIDDPQHPDAYFACRYFYKLASPERLPQSLVWCIGCPYWFPRPPLDLIRGHATEVENIRRYILTGKRRSRWKWSQTATEPNRSLWQRIRLKLLGW